MRDVVFPTAKQASYDAYGYSAAVKSGGFLFVSGQVGADAAGAAIAEPSAQFTQAFSNLAEVLDAAGCCFDDIVDVTTFHVNMYEYFETFAAVKAKIFPEPPFPNWTAVGVVNLADPALLLEIKVTAKLPKKEHTSA
ncbi:RidA family protein [Epibacterium ulvae]|uniref:RidA family protein n=1 Tax=Epibacterium ulvae TaxID=1156985 RepID=UPI00248FFE6A|nr:RidA family protein [Epibacterium ulvae]